MDTLTPCSLCGRAGSAAFALEDYAGQQLCDRCSCRVARLLFDLPTSELVRLWPSAGSLVPASQRFFREALTLPARESRPGSREPEPLERQTSSVASFGVGSLVGNAEGIAGVGRSFRQQARARGLPTQDGRPYALLGAARALLAAEGNPDERSRALNLLVCPELSASDVLVRLRAILFPL